MNANYISALNTNQQHHSDCPRLWSLTTTVLDICIATLASSCVCVPWKVASTMAATTCGATQHSNPELNVWDYMPFTNGFNHRARYVLRLRKRSKRQGSTEFAWVNQSSPKFNRFFTVTIQISWKFGANLFTRSQVILYTHTQKKTYSTLYITPCQFHRRG